MSKYSEFISSPHNNSHIYFNISYKKPLSAATVSELIRSLDEQYKAYSRKTLSNRGSKVGQLYIDGVRDGSIEILMVPDLIDLGKNGLAVLSASGPVEVTKAIFDFGERLSNLLSSFEKKSPKPTNNISVKDSKNVINIVNPVIEGRGNLNIFVTNGDGEIQEIKEIKKKDASNIKENAIEYQAKMMLPDSNLEKSVALIWSRFDRSNAKTGGATSPDKGIIESIDPNPKSVLFLEDEAGLKADILSSEENPMQMIYYVDVEVVEIQDAIRAYRIVGYHSSERLV